MKFISLLIILLTGFGARAANVVTSDVTNQGAMKKWHILFDANHQPALRDDQFDYTDFTFFFDYQYSQTHSFRVLQAPTKYYDIGTDQNEWSPSDTILYHFWNTGKSIGPTRFRWITSVNLPTSEEAQDNSKITTLTGTLQANTRLLGKLIISTRPYLRYNWYEFKTTPPTNNGGTGGGRPLSALIYGVNVVTSYQLTQKFSMNATFGYSQIHDYASQYESSTAGIQFGPERIEGRYIVSFGGNYEWTDKFATYFSYAQGDTYIRDGRYEVYAYDPVTTRLGLGATFYF